MAIFTSWVQWHSRWLKTTWFWVIICYPGNKLNLVMPRHLEHSSFIFVQPNLQWELNFVLMRQNSPFLLRCSWKIHLRICRELHSLVSLQTNQFLLLSKHLLSMPKTQISPEFLCTIFQACPDWFVGVTELECCGTVLLSFGTLGKKIVRVWQLSFIFCHKNNQILSSKMILISLTSKMAQERMHLPQSLLNWVY